MEKRYIHVPFQIVEQHKFEPCFFLYNLISKGLIYKCRKADTNVCCQYFCSILSWKFLFRMIGQEKEKSSRLERKSTSISVFSLTWSYLEKNPKESKQKLGGKKKTLARLKDTKSIYKINYMSAAAAAKSLQSCPTLCDPIDGSPPGSAIPGILQARTLEWVAISFSSAWKWKVKGKSLSRVQLFVTPWTAAYQAPPSMGFSRQEYWSGVPLPSPIICLYTSNKQFKNSIKKVIPFIVTSKRIKHLEINLRQ